MNEKWNEFRDFRRGQVYFADLEPRFGHEQGGIRPVVIVQNDIGNFYSPNVIITTMTRQIDKKPNQPTHVFLDNVGWLDPSMCMAENMFSLDKRRLGRFVGRLSMEQMTDVDKAMCASLSLRYCGSLPMEVKMR